MKILNLITIRYLKMNKSRTLITIIGIILSAAMITAVTTTISSFKTWMLEGITAADGIYHVYSNLIPAEEAEKIINDDEVKDTAAIYTHSYARFPDLNFSLDSFHGYYFISTLSDNFGDIRMWKLKEGRTPENGREIMLPSGLSNYVDNVPNIGEKVTANLGNRRDSEGTLLFEGNAFLLDDKHGSERETFEVTDTRDYTVVGYYDSTAYEFGMNDLNAYAVRAITGECDIEPTHEKLFLVLNNPRNYSSFLYKQDKLSGSLLAHYDYLSLLGAIPASGYGVVFFSLGSVLIAVIAIASISLIGSAFNISVTERTRQFGLLSSIGATKKQLKRSIILEAFLISAIAIPIGIISGILGMAITFGCIEDTIKTMLFEFTNCSSSELSIRVVPSLTAIVTAVICGILTVYFSALIPAHRAIKMTPLDAIRSTKDVVINPRSLKISCLTNKMLGIEGMLAAKYFKRSKKKYRATVLSISISVLLFIVAGTVISYLGTMLKSGYSGYDYHYSAMLYTLPSDSEMRKDIVSVLKNEECVSKITVSKELSGYYICNKDDTNEEWFNSGKYSPLNIIVIDDDVFEKFLSDNHLDKNKYMNPANREFLFSDYDTLYRNGDSKKTIRIFENENAEIECAVYVKGSKSYPTALDNNTGMLSFSDGSEKIHIREYKDYTTFRLGERVENLPIGYNGSMRLNVFIPESNAANLFPTLNIENATTKIFMNVVNPTNDFSAINEIIEIYPITTGLFNAYEEYVGIHSLFYVFSVLSYGFIVLMSLMSLINMFSTISTNIYLRKRDFAVLASVGMTSKGTMKMMIYECFLYGSKGLVYGIPLSFIVSIFLVNALSERIDVKVTLPFGYIAVAVFAVFLVIGIAMLYSVSKIRKENTVETVRSEIT